MSVAPPIPQPPPYTYTACGRSFGPIDVCLALAETAAVAGTVASVILKANWQAAVFGTAGVIVLGSHALYRKYGNIAAVIEQFKRVQAHFAGEVERQQETLRGYERQVQAASAENLRLGVEAQALRDARGGLERTVEELRQNLSRFQEENKALQEINQGLETKRAALEGLNREMKQRVADFAKQNGAFHSAAEKTARVASGLEKVAPALGGAVDAFDQTFDEDLADFDEQIEKIRALFASLQEQNEEYQRQIRQLEEAIAGLAKNGRDLEAGTAHLERLVESIERAGSLLQATQAELDGELDKKLGEKK